jgi:hypothetical protein
MDRRANYRERCHAVAPWTDPLSPLPHLGARQWRWWRGRAGVLLALGLLLLPAAAWAQTVGQGSCVGEDACTGNTGAVGNAACIGDFACEGNTGTVGHGSCVGAEACWLNSGTIGPGQCIGDRSCYQNTQNIP